MNYSEGLLNEYGEFETYYNIEERTDGDNEGGSETYDRILKRIKNGEKPVIIIEELTEDQSLKLKEFLNNL